MNQSNPNQDSQTRLALGDRAPIVTIEDHQGNSVTLSSLWQSQPRVMLFVRHFG